MVKKDSFNRLAIAAADPNQALTPTTTCSAITSTWCQQNGYDQWGNRWMPLATGLPSPNGEVPQASTAFNANNQISALTYDLAGNVTNFAGVRAATYDAENRQISARPSNDEPTVYCGAQKFNLASRSLLF